MSTYFLKKYKIFVYLCTGIIFLTGCSSNGFETENISYGEIIEESTQSSVSITETSLIPSESIDSELRYSSSGAEENQSAFNEEIPSSEVTSWCFYYEQLNDEEKKYLMLSAIADTRNATRENASLQSLALIAYDEQNLADAFKFTQSAIDVPSKFINLILLLIQLIRRSRPDHGRI